ncbi:hypothetical protein Tco_1154804 [Tanacetum coccineum]
MKFTGCHINVVDVFKLNMIVGHPNVTKVVVTHVGSFRLTDQIVIHDVLVVYGYEVNLLSVHKLSKDNKFRVMFDENVCVIQDYVQRKQVGTSNESNGLAECKEYDMVFQNKNSLNFINNDENESKSSEPNDHGRDIESERSKGTNNTSLGGIENTKSTRRNEVTSNESTSEEATSDVDDSAILEENDSESEGDDNFYQEFNEMFETPNMVPDN